MYWLFAISEVAENPDAVTKHGSEALEKAVLDILCAVSKDLPAHKQQTAAQAMIDMVHPRTIRQWTESKLA